MGVLDLIAGVVVVALLVRGWMRGLLREAIELAVLLVGSFLVFRLSPVLGSIISGMANAPYEASRIVAAVILFIALVVGGVVLSRILAAALKVVPGATLLNRLGGAVVGVAYAFLLLVLATTLLAAVPLPDSQRADLDAAIQSSAIGGTIADPDGIAGDLLATVSGEDVLQKVVAIREIVGSRLVAGTIPVPLPSIGDATLIPSQTAAQEVFDALNRERVSAGHDPLAWSSDLAVIAVARAGQVYKSGVLSLDDGLGQALAAQGVPGTIHTDMVVLAASSAGIVEAFVTTPTYLDATVDQQYNRAGVAVVEGPYGLIAVQVLSG